MAAMRRVVQAPNLMIATLWADMLTQAGFAATVQRAYASSIAGEIPPDQSLPEVWVADESHHARALALVRELQNPAERRWVCDGCGEVVEGPFEQCWACGRLHFMTG